MPPRFRTSFVLTFFFLFLYVLLPFSKNAYLPSKEGRYPIVLLNAARPVAGEGGGGWLEETETPKTPQQPMSKPTSTTDPQLLKTPTSSPSSAKSRATNDTLDSGPVKLDEFEKEHDAFGLERSAGKIYGSSLRRLVDMGKHAGPHAAALTSTQSWTPYSGAPPFKYNPYPDYNNKPWSMTYKGRYVPCDGPNGELPELLVFSGRPEAFREAPIGSWGPLGIDSSLCFERESRLGAYGYVEDTAASKAQVLRASVDWDSVNWGQLQNFCFEKNSNRYTQLERMPQFINHSGESSKEVPMQLKGSRKATRAEASKDTAEVRELGLHGLPKTELKQKSRTAILLRAYSGMKYTDNDKQNIRSVVAELSLRSGGEYQVYLLVQIKEDLPIWSDLAAHEKAIRDNVPKEFRDMTVLWDDAVMTEWYPLVPSEANTVHKAQWFSVQKFAQENPQFDYYWNWELDTRYTGHHYDLLEQLAEFAQKQPRKGLWERNERYYVPSSHAHDYDTKFRNTVEDHIGEETVWGAPPVANVTPTGPKPPTIYDDDDYVWGVGEQADYITLAPIFNPVGSNWIIRDELWGYGGPEHTPRRATIGTHSRCSKQLLDVMHAENLKGNHVSSEMTPQTVALLHGLKAVYAPIPIFLDRDWPTKSVEKWFNPCPKDVSGSCQESAFGWGKEGRFSGSTWYFRAVSPMRLYNNWMGWEDSGIGGPEWEKKHGRACLPSMLLHPIKEVVKPPPGHYSKSELPY